MVVENEQYNLNFEQLPAENSYANLRYVQVLNVFFKVFDEIGITDS